MRKPILFGASLLAASAMAMPALAQDADGNASPPSEDRTVPVPTIDTDGDGAPDAWDQRGDGRPDSWDTDGDGRPDVFDRDGDGEPDEPQ
ncbi:hypothetical protein HFP51_01515 [Parasphingopyxis sp. CP4]|uniref:hypothetical protein n=1 Tax=Parasphingopyxis sp. CP4 TaxID=2724527 RepID=UPI0015A4E77E|nr:hypothetical protein [Parasphingopyxis sp. CP4]QLC20979.1 hypothetical protein HFP51_01515 [Parasphingopyxis sp. CP4]